MNTVADFNLNEFVATRCAIADIALANFGRKEIASAETEICRRATTTRSTFYGLLAYDHSNRSTD